MTEAEARPRPAAPSAPRAETRPERASARLLLLLRRTPWTASFVLSLLIVGVATGTLWTPAVEQRWYPMVATGIPSFAEGRWWTIFTSPFFVDHPIVYLLLMPLIVGGLGWAEWRFGGPRMALLALGGHIVGVLGAAGILLLVSASGWHWAVRLTESLDVGPSCAAFTALVFAIATLPAPWRLRGRIAVGVWVGISVLYLGELYDLEHAVAMTLGLVVSGWLPAFRHPAGRPTQREWRFIGLSALIAIGVIQVFNLIVPFNGPLGENHPVASAIDVTTDVAVILLIANGIRRGYRIAWVGAVLTAVFNLATAALGFILLPAIVEAGAVDSPRQLFALLLAPAILWAALLVFLIVGRNAFEVRFLRSRRALDAAPLSRDELLTRLERFGGGTISWMTTWDANQRIAVGDGAIAYQSHAGAAIVLGDPITPDGGQRAALEQFAHVTQQAGLVPCVFSASATTAEARPEGWRSVIVAEDTIVDLPGLAFTGKRWNDVRTAINRAAREEVAFRMVRLADEPWNVLAQVRAISEQWAGDKGLPEMRFTLGTVEEALDPAVFVGLAVDAGGNLHGVTSWLPVYGPANADGTPRIVGWTLDLMRRRDGGFGPVMEFLIASSARHFSEAGYEFVSLSGAPLVRPAEAAAGPVDQVLDQLGGLIEPLYGFKSLHRFKQKFNPRSQSLHLLFRDEGDLPRIGLALTRAYLPDASMRDLVSSAAGMAGQADG